MQAQARAGVEIHENVLRYAEVEQGGEGYRLLRLGSCDFDFDIAESLLGGGDPEKLDTLAEALKDVFAGTVADNLHVAVHPPGGYSFFTPLPASLALAEREQRINQEVDLLVGGDSGGPLYISSDPVFDETAQDGRAVSWFHVWAVQDHIFDRFERLFSELPYRNNRLKLSMQAAASVVTAMGRSGRGGLGRGVYTLALGWYGSFVEYTLLRNGRWYFSHYARVSSAADAAYFALTLLRRLNVKPTDVAQVYLYGRSIASADFSLLQAVFGRAPERLNPVSVVDLNPGSLSPEFEAEAYVPCIGVALS